MREECLSKCVLYMKGLWRLDQMCSWGLWGQPTGERHLIKFVFEWAEQVGRCKEPTGLQNVVSSSPVWWLAGCPPAAVSLAQLHAHTLKVFSHVDPVYVRS